MGFWGTSRTNNLLSQRTQFPLFYSIIYFNILVYLFPLHPQTYLFYHLISFLYKRLATSGNKIKLRRFCTKTNHQTSVNIINPTHTANLMPVNLFNLSFNRTRPYDFPSPVMLVCHCLDKNFCLSMRFVYVTPFCYACTQPFTFEYKQRLLDI